MRDLNEFGNGYNQGGKRPKSLDGNPSENVFIKKMDKMFPFQRYNHII